MREAMLRVGARASPRHRRRHPATAGQRQFRRFLALHRPGRRRAACRGGRRFTDAAAACSRPRSQHGRSPLIGVAAPRRLSTARSRLAGVRIYWNAAASTASKSAPEIRCSSACSRDVQRVSASLKQTRVLRCPPASSRIPAGLPRSPALPARIRSHRMTIAAENAAPSAAAWRSRGKRAVPGRPDITLAGYSRREAKRVCDPPDAASSYRISPGRIGRPAASAEVHPAGRKPFEARSKVAPDCVSAPRARLLRSEQLIQPAAFRVQHQHVSVAPVLHPGGLGNHVRTGSLSAGVCVNATSARTPRPPVTV